MKVTDLGSGYYVVKFASFTDYDYVLSGCHGWCSNTILLYASGNRLSTGDSESARNGDLG